MEPQPQPPKWATRFLGWFCKPHLLEDIEGDLHELFWERVRTEGLQTARRQYYWDVIRYLRPHTLKKRKAYHLKPLPTGMLSNYMTIAGRHLLRQKLYTGINLFGLATGVAFCLLTWLFVQHEYSFDRFHVHADRIYRIDYTDYVNASFKRRTGSFLGSFQAMGSQRTARLPIPLGPALAEAVPEVAQVTRLREGETVVGRTRADNYKEPVLFVDANFFQFFSFKLLQGNPQTVMAGPRSIVLTPEVARKYFRNENPIGKTLMVNLGEPTAYTVTGLVEKARDHSSIRFEVILPLESIPDYAQYKDQRLNYFSIFTLVKLRENVAPAALQKKIILFGANYFKENIDGWRREKKIASHETGVQMQGTPLADTHFDMGVFWPNQSNKLYGYILGSIAGLILLIACINYVSLALTNAASRMQEVGIRKVLGANRGQVVVQMWLETQLLVAAALVLAVGLTAAFLPLFNAFAKQQLSLNVFARPEWLVAWLGLGLVVSLLAGGYPALLLSGFNPVRILKGNSTYRFNPALSRVLVVVQYAFCLFLIATAVVMHRQMQYVLRKDLGFDKEQVVVLENMEADEAKRKQLWERMQRYAATHPDVMSVASTNTSFGKGSMTYFYDIEGQSTPVDIFNVDYNYVPLLGLKLLQGRNFSPAFPTDSIRKEAVIINETLSKLLGKDGRAGTSSRQLDMHVIGVVKDYHYSSLEMKIGPALLWLKPAAASNFLIKIRPGDPVATLPGLERDWKNLSGGQPFSYSYLDQDIAGQYRAYTQWTKMLGAATGFAIFIACLGLFGLSGLNAVNRTKEVGIRKVLGASVSQILLLLNRDVVRLAGVSFILAVPIAWYLMRRWLEDFAYRVEIGPEIFAVAGGAGLLTALLAVSFHSVKAARANPVDSLRSE